MIGSSRCSVHKAGGNSKGAYVVLERKRKEGLVWASSLPIRGGITSFANENNLLLLTL